MGGWSIASRLFFITIKVMIYITKFIDNEVTTDNIVDFIPDNLDVYLDDNLLGTYVNLSTYKHLLLFIIPSEDLVDYAEKDYSMKILNHFEKIKEELVCIKELSTFEVKSINKTNKIVMYD